MPPGDATTNHGGARVDQRLGVYRFRPAGTSVSTEPLPGSSIGEALWSSLLNEAGRLGLERLGVATPEALPAAQAALKRWLGSGFAGSMSYLSGTPRGDPRQLLPEVKAVLVAAMPHARPSQHDASDGRGEVACYALGDDYHHVLRERLLRLAQWLADAVGHELLARVCVDTAPLLERALAARAGISFTGKSTLSIVPGVGSWFVLGELLIDLELPASTDSVANGCGQCTRCLDFCPTRAFVEPYVLDARRCISYLTIEHQGTIPRALREPIGTRVFGCDECQTVCPYNQTRKAPESVPELSARPGVETPQLLALLELSSSAYRRWTKKSAMRRVSRQRLQRNAAVALGNALVAGTVEPQAAVVALARALRENPSALVREHVAWALGRARSSEAHTALSAARETETDRAVLDEITLSLQESVSDAPR